MQLKYMGSKSWLAPHMDRLLGDVTVLHSPFFGSGKLEYYLAARRPALEVRGVDAFEPVANLHRCYLRQDPVSCAPCLVGRKVDRRFYFSHLLPGAQERPRRAPGRLLVRPAAQQLLGKVGLLHTAAAAGPEQRAASAAASHKCNRAMPGRTGPSARSAQPSAAALYPCRPSLHLPRPQHELPMARGGGSMTWPSRLHHKAVLGQERLQAGAAGSASGQSCVWQSCAQHRTPG